jgi:hypothetical protein
MEGLSAHHEGARPPAPSQMISMGSSLRREKILLAPQRSRRFDSMITIVRSGLPRRSAKRTSSRRGPNPSNSLLTPDHRERAMSRFAPGQGGGVSLWCGGAADQTVRRGDMELARQFRRSAKGISPRQPACRSNHMRASDNFDAAKKEYPPAEPICLRVGR